MREVRFSVFGALVAIRAEEAGGWTAFRLVPDGKRRTAEFVVPDFVAESELCQYLEDLFHESETPTNGEVVQLLGDDK
jgi:hypothetical protein